MTVWKADGLTKAGTFEDFQKDVEEAINRKTNTPTLTSKDTNPKDAVGVAKVPFGVIPWGVIAKLGLALMEGARKYGRHNYRIAGVRASVYFDACLRHLTDWYEGTDEDPDSELSHVDKAIASLVVLRDAMLSDKWIDDRPPTTMPHGWQQEDNKHAKKLIEKYPDAKPAYTLHYNEP